MRADIEQARAFRMVGYIALCVLSVLSLSSSSSADQADYGDNFSGNPENIGPLIELYAAPVPGNDLVLGVNNDLETATNTPPEGSGQGDVDDGIHLKHEGKGWYAADYFPLNPGQSYPGRLEWKYSGENSYDYGYYVFADTDADGRLDAELLQGWCAAQNPTPPCPALGQNGLVDQVWNVPVDASALPGSYGYIRAVISQTEIASTQNDFTYPEPDPSLTSTVISGVAATSDGGVVIVGDSSPSSGPDRMRIIKVNVHGEAEWDQVVPNEDYAQGFKDVIESVDAQGNRDGYLAVGYGNCSSCSPRMRIMKLNLDGSVAWERIFPEESFTNGAALKVIQTSDVSGDYVIVSMPNTFMIKLLRLDRDNPTDPASDIFDIEIPAGEHLNAWGINMIESKQSNGSPDAYMIVAPINAPTAGFPGGFKLLKLDHESGDLLWSYSTGYIQVPGFGMGRRGLVQKGNGGNYFVSTFAPQATEGLEVNEVSFSGSTLLNKWTYPQFSFSNTGLHILLERDGDRYFLSNTPYAGNPRLQEINAQGAAVGDTVYFGGSGGEAVYDMAIDRKGCIDIAGSTSSFGSWIDAWLHAECPRYAVAGALSGGEVEDYEFIVSNTSANKPPVAVDDSASTTVNKAVNVKVLLNDSDPDGDPILISSFTRPAHGSVALISQGKVLRYTPASGYKGGDSFTYTIKDSKDAADTATVTLTVDGGGRP